jgi:cytoskeleton protein RodZ
MSLGAGEQTSPAPPEAAPATALQTPGALLQQERVRRGLSVQQAAEGLHLDAWIIEAIESNHFLALGAPVYAKGYLRKYAALLELGPDMIVTRYEGLSDTPVVPTPIPVITTTPPPRPKWPKYVAWTLIAAAAIGIGLLAYKLLMPPDSSPLDTSPSVEGAGTQERPRLAPAPAVSTPEAPEPQAQTIAPSAVNDARQVAIPETKPVEVAPERPQAAPLREPQASAAQAMPVADGPSLQVRVEFSEASWIEVYDATGKRLLFDVGQPGRPRVVSGIAPLSVVIGLAAAVGIQVNDRAIVVPRRANKDSTRFTIGADGAVQ